MKLPLDLVLDILQAEFDELIKARMLTRRVIVKKEIFAQCVIIIRQRSNIILLDNLEK